MQRIARLAFVVCLLSGEVAAVLVFERLGRVAGFTAPHQGVARWLLHSPTEDLIATAGRLFGLALAWWLLAATVLSVARRIVPGWHRLRAFDALTPRVLRHALDRGLALGLGASIAFGGMHPAGASAARGPTRAPVATVTTIATRGDQPVPRAPGTAGVPTVPRPRAGNSPVAAPPSNNIRAVVVRAGDNLWVIARRALRPGAGAPTANEIVPYWRRLIAANAGTLRSHDPNLIFPGERVVLPPTSEGPAAG